MSYQDSCERQSRLEKSFYKLSKEEQVTLITKLWSVREAAEDALFEYFSQMIDAGDFKASSQKKALEELRELAQDLKKEK